MKSLCCPYTFFFLFFLISKESSMVNVLIYQPKKKKSMVNVLKLSLTVCLALQIYNA